ncbi:pirin family protein [Chitiniphilus shinanonensis]|uniref:Pirin family protein n=1 Tax=Chitiniphilus shinanonensis TaxID=553088 RepID=A0ABQ6BZN3_9NEIS|nr:pirin family protein [Chitiniphilus shinanonensis]GLS05184.1 pirin family protein [Chitiniphilus shinanonensis]
MRYLRKANDRGYADHGWLQSRHSFSFADYHDPNHMQFGALRVINEDRVQSGMGFGTHSHRDMEIISYVLSGQLQHRDSMGNTSVIGPGNVQRMSAGTGVTHSEFNPSNSEPVHFLQIWIIPEARGLTPSYEEKVFDEAEKRGRLRLVASPDGVDGSVRLHQDARLYIGLFDGDEHVQYAMQPGRGVYLHVARGEVEVDGQRLQAGDALMVEEEASLELRGGKNAEVLLFDLA